MLGFCFCIVFPPLLSARRSAVLICTRPPQHHAQHICAFSPTEETNFPLIMFIPSCLFFFYSLQIPAGAALALLVVTAYSVNTNKLFKLNRTAQSFPQLPSAVPPMQPCLSCTAPSGGCRGGSHPAALRPHLPPRCPHSTAITQLQPSSFPPPRIRDTDNSS